jgi:hypothetical protein
MRDAVILFLHLIVTVVDVQDNDTKSDRVEIDPGEKTPPRRESEIVAELLVARRREGDAATGCKDSLL